VSQENVEITRQTLDAFNRGDRGAWLAMFDSDAEMVPAPEWPENEPLRGAEAIWDFYVEVTGTWQEGFAELGEVIDAGADQIVANNRRDARGRTSGAGVEFSYWPLSPTGTERWSGWTGSPIEPRPLKRLASRSRRWRRRTWTWFVVGSRSSRIRRAFKTSPQGALISLPTSSLTWRS
jgi:ketosteroid isomerase-like protein